jgi:GNAT superfamily N-acetyltransferase
VRLRRGRPADAPALARLRWEFRAALGRPNESRASFVRRCAAWMRPRLGRGSTWKAWIVEDSGTPVGHLWLAVIDKVPNPVPEPECHGYVTNVYVLPRYRGAGLGQRLMDAATSWCDANAIDSVVLWPTPKSRSLYRRHGFRPPPTMLEKTRR